MYKIEDIALQKRKILIYYSLLFIISIPFVLISYISLVHRIFILSVAASSIYFACVFFILFVYILPAYHYKKMLCFFLNPRGSYIEGIVKSISKDINFYDGIAVYSIVLKTGENKDGDIEAICYMDSNKITDISVSDKLHIDLFDRFMISYSKL